MRLSEPDADDPARVPPFWLPAAAGAIETLVERGLYEQAKALGVRVLALCRAREIEAPALEVERALSLAHAKLGDFETAVAVLNQVIAVQKGLGVTGLLLGASYEARARVAIWARDEEALTEFGRLTAREYRRGAGSALGACYERLMDEARLAFPHRIAALGDADLASAGISQPERQPSAARVANQVLRQATTATERAAFALSLLCEDRDAVGGYLYLVTDRGWVLAASQGVDKPDPALGQFARAFLIAELEESELATRVEAAAEPARGRRQRQQCTAQGVAHPVALGAVRDGSLNYAGVALLVLDSHAAPRHGDERCPAWSLVSCWRRATRDTARSKTWRVETCAVLCRHRDSAVVAARAEPRYRVGAQLASGLCMSALSLLRRLNTYLCTAALLVTLGACGDDDADADSPACRATNGCYCAPEQEGKSFCLQCGTGYDCVHGRRMRFYDGICDARSEACGQYPDVDSGAAATDGGDAAATDGGDGADSGSQSN